MSKSLFDTNFCVEKNKNEYCRMTVTSLQRSLGLGVLGRGGGGGESFFLWPPDAYCKIYVDYLFSSEEKTAVLRSVDELYLNRTTKNSCLFSCHCDHFLKEANYGNNFRLCHFMEDKQLQYTCCMMFEYFTIRPIMSAAINTMPYLVSSRLCH